MLLVGLQSCTIGFGAALREELELHVLFGPANRVLVNLPAPNR